MVCNNAAVMFAIAASGLRLDELRELSLSNTSLWSLIIDVGWFASLTDSVFLGARCSPPA